MWRDRRFCQRQDNRKIRWRGSWTKFGKGGKAIQGRRGGGGLRKIGD